MLSFFSIVSSNVTSMVTNEPLAADLPGDVIALQETKLTASAQRAMTSSLKEQGSVKVLRLNTAPYDYRVLLAGSEVDSFEKTMRGYAGLWCCNRPPGGRGAGHIWYDFLWDVLPHKDRFNRKWEDKWVPKMGP